MSDAANNPGGEDAYDDVEDTKQPLIAHLVELRNRLLYSVIAVFLAFIFCFIFAENIYDFLVDPLFDLLKERQDDPRMIFTALHEAFFTQIKLAFWAAFMLAFPIIASQLYMFVAPGLYQNEKSAFLPFLIATPILFLLGAGMVYYMVMPFAWEFFLSFENPGAADNIGIQLEAKVGEYLSLVMKLLFAFGFCFQLPVLLTLLAKVGIASAQGMRDKRKYAIVGVFVVAAIITPPDPISQITLAIPIILLYEISILCAVYVERKRDKEQAEADAA